MVQSNKVKEKYEYIYGACDLLIRSAIQNESASPDEIYAYLQMAVPAAWAALAQGESPLKNSETLSQAVTRYSETPCEMTAGGSRYKDSLGQIEYWKRDFICNALKDVDADCVLDLGSGWSHRLVDLWRSGVRRDAPHFACELTVNGRKCCESLHSLFPDMDMRPVSFNMLDPDFGFITDNPKHGLILTVHAVEQIPEISPTLVDEIIARFEKVTVAHFEPITFQLPNQAQENPDRYARDIAHASRHNHNQNLFGVLSSHPKVKDLEVEPAVWQAGEQHSVSLIKWQAERT